VVSDESNGTDQHPAVQAVRCQLVDRDQDVETSLPGGLPIETPLRASQRQKALIDRAADALGRNRSDFMLEAACREAAQGAVVEAVNYNSAGQVVIAGETAAVQRAAEAAKARGAKRVLTLAVSVPSHSSLLKPAAEKLGERLKSVEFHAPRIRYVSAVDGKTYSNPAELRPLLVKQLASPVRWQDAVRGLAGTGAQQIIECGPGKVLMGLNKRVEGVSGVAFGSTDEPAAFDAALTATKGS